MSSKPTIENQAFYELMQAYRHCPMIPPQGPAEAYQAVIKFANDYAERRVQEALAADESDGYDEIDHDRLPAMQQSNFLRNQKPSDLLAAIVGNQPLPRTEITKIVWGYIKDNRLQDATNLRMINADDKLKEIFGGKSQVSLFELTKLISDHLVPV